jgi:hypothetical protein
MKDSPLIVQEPLQNLINFLERTKEDSWCMEVVRTKDQKQNCLFGHVFDWGGNIGWDWFENFLATTYMVFPVNDKSNSKYQRDSIKERNIQYLKNLLNGTEKTVMEIMDEYDLERRRYKIII